MRNYRRFKKTAATAKLKVKREKKRKKGMQEMFTAVENQQLAIKREMYEQLMIY